MDHDHDAPQRASAGAPREDLPLEEALVRLEDVLHAYPYDRALPELAVILDAAGVGEDLLRADDRAAKLLHEAILARPLSSYDAVTRAQTEVELLTLEVGVLQERLTSPDVAPGQVERVRTRLDRIRQRLVEVRSQL